MKGQIKIIFIGVLVGIVSLCFGQKVGFKTGAFTNDIFQTAVFVQNNGVVPDYQGLPIQYYVNHDNLAAYFTEQGVIYKVSGIDKKYYKEHQKEEREKEKDHEKEGEEESAIRVITQTIWMQWQGANPHPKIVVEARSQGYYTCMKQEGDATNSIISYGYKTITYKDLYPGIDVVYSFPDKGGMKYNLVVKPGADAAAVKMLYSGGIKNLRKKRNGNLVIHTASGDIVEHAPISFTDEYRSVKSEYKIKDRTVAFSFPNGYDANSTLTIDPWVAFINSLPFVNVGFGVDYDYVGETYIYGAGPSNFNYHTPFQVAKYDSAGVFKWTFGGTVSSINWSTVDTFNNSYPANIIVDKKSGKLYVGQPTGLARGATAVRLKANGTYDNFVTRKDTMFDEMWGIAYNCATGVYMGLGSGTHGPYNVAVFDTVSGIISPTNITGDSTFNYQDIVCDAYDNNNNLYVLINSGTNRLPYANSIYRINSTNTGNSWVANSGYSVFRECYNAPYWSNIFLNAESAMWFNCLAANGSYLYYYDGMRLKAFDLATGDSVGTTYVLGVTTYLNQGGIAVDECNNIYVGDSGGIKTFTFNGNTFTPGTRIPLGAAYASKVVHDVKMDRATNQLYVCGKGVVGVFNATLSGNCTPNNGSFTLQIDSTCNSATATIVPAPGTVPISDYTWYDTSGTIVRHTYGTTALYNYVTNLTPQRYKVKVVSTIGCKESAIWDSVFISNVNLNLLGNDTTICLGTSLNLTANPSVPGGTCLWTPGGSTANSVNVAPSSNSVYHVSYLVNGCTSHDSISVSIDSTPKPTLTTNSPLCAGQTMNLQTSITGGFTYHWQGPNGFSSYAQNPHINNIPASDSGYYRLTITGTCGSKSDSSFVHITPLPNYPVITTNNPVCAGQTLNLFTPVTGNATCQWTGPNGFSSTLPNPSIPNITRAGIGNYTVVVTNSCGYDYNFVIISVDSTPGKPSITSNSPLCSSQSLQLQAVSTGNFVSYQWSGPNGFSSNLQNPTLTTPVAGVYYVAASTGSCPPAIDSVTVTLLGAGNITAGSNSPLCATQALQLTSTSITGATYSWTGPNGFTSNLQNPTLPNPIAGVYTVAVTSGSCGPSLDSTTVTLATSPGTITASSNSPICPGQTLQLTGTTVNGATYSWTGPNGFTSNQQNPTVANASGGVYYLSVSINGCAASVDSTTVTLVTGAGTISASSNSPLCPGQTLQLTGTTVNGATYSWTGPSGFTSNQQNPAVANASGGVYYLSVSNNGCAASVDSTTVTLFTGPGTITASSNSPICPGQTLQLNATSLTGATYSWIGPNGFTSNQQNPIVANASSGVYYLSVSINGCAPSVDSTTVTLVTGAGTISASSNSPLCPGQTLQLTGTTVNGATYSWTGPNGYTASVQNPSKANIVAADTGVYSLVVTTGCGSITVYDTVNITSTIPISITANNPACINDTLRMSVPLVNNATYLWSGPNGFTSQTNNPKVYPVSHSTAGVYQVTVTYNGGCSSTDTVAISVADSAIIKAGSSGRYCYTDTIFFNAGNGFTSYHWSTGDTTQTLIVDATGIYGVTVTDANGCKSTDSINIVRLPKTDTVTIAQVGDTLVASWANANHYQWFMNGDSIFTDSSRYLVITQSGNYSVAVLDSDHCTTTSATIFANYTGVNALSEVDRFDVFPNPANGQFYIRYSGAKDKDFRLNLFNSIGARVIDTDYHIKANQVISIDVKLLAAGTYLVLLHDGNNFMSKKIVLE